MIRRAPLVFLYLALLAGLPAQTTQGLITGSITDARDRGGLDALVSCRNLATGATVSARTDRMGVFSLPLLPPGLYHLRIESPNYQPAERYDLDLPVAGFLQQNFALHRLSDVWRDTQYATLPGKQRVVTAYGPDAGPGLAAVQPVFSRESGIKGELEPSLSYVIGSELLDALPLAGRDTYALLALLPGIASDISTSRGLGLSAAGQRPSASNFLLDGLENNNFVTTGPLVPVAPEAIQEYRISTADFSAEYGRTSGFLANAVTRAGGDRYHGLLYFNLSNQHLDANGFQQNAHRFTRPSLHGTQPGFSAGGPIRRGLLFFSLSADFERYRSQLDPAPYTLPTTSLPSLMAPGSSALALLELFPPTLVSPAGAPTEVLSLRPPSSTDHITGVPRLDWQILPSGHLTLRALAARQRQPDFDWSPYPQFTTPLQDTTLSPGAAFALTLTPHTVSETRASYTLDDVAFNRVNNQVPGLTTTDHVTLPGSLLSYSYRNRSSTVELVENWTASLALHTVKFGATHLYRSLYGYLAPLQDGQFTFASLKTFESSTPSGYSTMELRQGALGTAPDYRRNYDYRQISLYAQDSFRPARRLVIELGVRYENFGAPRNTGAVKDALIDPGAGNRATAYAPLSFLSAPSGGERLYDSDNRDFAVRTGVSLALSDDGRTLVHGAYGIFYDKPFDNEWQTLSNNNIVFVTALSPGAPNLLATPAQLLRNFAFSSSAEFPEATLFQGGLRNGLVQEAFIGLQHQFTRNFLAEWTAVTSSGARLLTTDQINRQVQNGGLPSLNPYPVLNYRAAQGISRYAATTAAVRYRSSPLIFQASYTWSHSIDNQSEPLLGEFFNLESVGPVSAQSGSPVAGFVAQQQPAADHANSDFDQRQNLVFLATWLPAPQSASRFWRAAWNGWRLSPLAAFRSGLPYSVTVSQAFSPLVNNTANLVQPQIAFSGLPAPVSPGGAQLLNAAAFRVPASTARGNLGRNAWSGPGFYSADLSLSRTIALPRLPEGWRLTFRADAFNFLNHANLDNPCGFLGSVNFSGCGSVPFGEALYGRRGRNPGYPAVTPLDETPRQIQLLLRLSF